MKTFNKFTQTNVDKVLIQEYVLTWYKAFLENEKTVQDEYYSGWPITSKTEEKVRKLLTFIRYDQWQWEWFMMN